MELSGGSWSCQAELLLQLGAELAHRMCEAWSMFSRQFVKGFNFSGGDQENVKIKLKRSLKRLFDGLCVHTHMQSIQVCTYLHV